MLLGDEANHVDIDIDSNEALSIASEFLPETGLIFGRKSNPESRRFYRASEPLKSRRFQDPILGNDGKHDSIVEIRALKSDGSVGLQTVVPPSVHKETGERIRFEPGYNKAASTVDAAFLTTAVARLAATALLARHWPGEGSRHDAFLALAGTLVCAGWGREDILPKAYELSGVFKPLSAQRRSTYAAGATGGALGARCRGVFFTPAARHSSAKETRRKSRNRYASGAACVSEVIPNPIFPS